MQFTKLDINKHDLNIVSELIFETEPELFSLLFGYNKQIATSRIKKIVSAGNTSFGYNNIFLAVKKDLILGLTIIYVGNEIDKKNEFKQFSETFDFIGLFKLYFLENFVLNRLLTRNLGKNEMYISNLCVDKNNRKQGIGNFLLKNIFDKAKSKNCETIVLDVSNENNVAIDLYKKFGFKISKKRKSLIGKVTTLKMIKNL
jgi:ribosomal protein S18 acetylase RimI-like enzyme